GIKTSNVVRAECFGEPAIAVDTHVARVATRLGYCKKGEDPVKIEAILERRFPKEKWIKLHHQIIWFGRLVCHAKNPECGNCPLQPYCRYFKKSSSKTGR
ncbi:MAG: endonuclease III, partial [Bacilli bacterium]|nr:endonuclease III [Bacilli bacterium]